MRSLLALLILVAALAVGACDNTGGSPSPSVNTLPTTPLTSPGTSPEMSPELSPELSPAASPSA